MACARSCTALLLILVLIPGLATCGGEGPPVQGEELSLSKALGSVDATGHAIADGPRRFSFPADHGPHPDYRNEWWYFTGRVQGRDERGFGFELTLFRVSLWPPEESAAEPVRGSAWRSRQLFFAHFAVTDVARGSFHAAQRWSRGALDLAGARPEPPGVWVEGWHASLEADRWRLVAADGAVAIDLWLLPVKPVVLNGEQGLSRKSAGAGQASYYYSLPRLAVSGELAVPGWRGPVQGLAWLDREWSTSALAADQLGWDWFALQLDDGSELMLYQLRRADGSPDSHSGGTRVAPDGQGLHLPAGTFDIQVLDHWDSPLGGRYPAAWRIEIPPEQLVLEVRPLVANQELDTVPRYWEGAVSVRGRRQGEPVSGGGYVELTGYAGRGPARR